MLPAFLRSARHVLAILLTIASAGGVIGYTWYATEQSIEARRLDAVRQADTTVTGLATNYGELISRQIIALDQTLADMVRDYEADPRRFDLENERSRARVLTGISRDMFLADENGIIRQASVSDFLGQSVGDLDAFHDAAEHTNDKPRLYLGGASINPIMRQWHLDAARTLHHPDGSFAGIIVADYRLAAVNDVFTTASPPGNGFAALIGLADGKLRVAYGAAGATPDASIADTPMFAAVDASESGLWVGPSATDAVIRIHAFRRIPGRDLAVVAGVDETDVLRPVVTWRWQSRLSAAAITGLTLALTVVLLGVMRSGRRRAATERETLARFAAAHALADVSRAQADAIARRLQATFAAVADGVAIFDAHLNLVEWNALFTERSGVNASLIRTGMPMEDVLRTQAEDGYFGVIPDIDAEVERRAMLLRAGNFGASQSFQAGARSIELRCRPLAEGGFVALYTDVTEARRARQALRDARDVLLREQSARMRFLGVIAFELRERTALLMRSISRLRAMQPEPAQVKMLERIRGIGETIAELATDTIEVPQMEANALVPRPALVTVRTLLQDIVATIQPAAEDRGITVYLVVNEAAPVELIADPGRVRQIVTLLLSEAIRIAAPDTMWLLADGGDGEREALRLTIRGFGEPVPEDRRAAMFPAVDSIAAPDRSGGDAPSGETSSFLGPAIARHLTTLMGGDLRCEGWSTMDGRTGNDFILSLPPDLLPGQGGRAPGQVPGEGRPWPRTRVLLIGAVTGLRMAAVTMLRRDGHMVDAVTTMEVAMPLLENAPYDIVFIDSVLQGTTVEQAIATIRDSTGPARVVPLIVLAPRPDESEARGWQDAGVDDIIANDPTLEDLARAIGRNVWLSRTTSPGMGFMPGLEEETEEGIPILASDRIAELRANIPAEELLEMVEECIADLFHRLPALRRSLAVGAPGAITAQAHAMVGMAGGYGMAVLEARLRAILTAVRGRRLDTIDGAAAVIEADLTRAAAALRRTLGHGQHARSDVKT
jgi:signal transduction histidine kinase/CheY-like chemotaxis protein